MRGMYKSIKHFQQKWMPVLRRKMRKNKELERSAELGEVKTALALILLIFGLSACMRDVRETFDFAGARVVPMQSQATSHAGAAQKLRQIQILIATPSALKIFDGEEIVVANGSGSIAYLKQAQLSDRLPQMVQTRLVQAFEDSGLFGGVGRPGDGLATNYQLLSDVRAFGILGATSPQMAQIEISMRIINDRNGVVRAARVFTSKQAVMGEGNAAYAQALERAFSHLLRDIVNWTVENL